MTSAISDVPDQDLREQAAQHTLAANPLVGVRGRDIAESARTPAVAIGTLALLAMILALLR